MNPVGINETIWRVIRGSAAARAISYGLESYSDETRDFLKARATESAQRNFGDT
jgi:hypothetical protein